jgi:NAD(P)-dependent dehydrogenase (short-subunit alcohol dehydrogenase family)
MAKAGVNSLVRSLSRELADHRVNVNAIAPGLIATPMTQDRLDDPEKREKSMKAIPWSRPGAARGDCWSRPVPRLRRSRLRHRPDLDDGRRPDDELGRGLAAFLRDTE